MAAHGLDYEEALRRLALDDERFVASILALHRDQRAAADPAATDEALLRTVATLDGRTRSLVGLAAIVAMSSGGASIESAVERALGAGATIEDVIGVVVSIAPEVGSARVVDCAPFVAAAVGYDVWTDLEGFGRPLTQLPPRPASRPGSLDASLDHGQERHDRDHADDDERE